MCVYICICYGVHPRHALQTQSTPLLTLTCAYVQPGKYVLFLFNLDLCSALLQTTSSALKGAIQLGITHTVGSLSQKPERDVLMQDFEVVESIFFPRCV